MPELEFTGERVVPGAVDPNLFNEHLARYRFAALFAEDARVLDAGCGTGYGGTELKRASFIAAADISAEAVGYARATWDAERRVFLQARCEALPFRDASFDLVLAFEVIEHLEHWQSLLSEARRVLSPTGVLLVSTPNKAWYEESRAAAGPNPWHVHEFEFEEFRTSLGAEFAHVHLWTQNHSEAIAFVPAAAGLGTLDAAGDGAPAKAHYFLAACSQSAIAYTNAFGWLPSSGNVLRERQEHIALLEGEIRKKDQWLVEAQDTQAALQESFDQLEAELTKSNEWAAHLDREMEKARGVTAELREELRTTRAGYEEQIARAEAAAASRLEWIAGLEEQIARGNAEIARQKDEIATQAALIAERTEWAHSLDHEMNQEREAFRQLEQQHRITLEHLAHTQAELENAKAQLSATEAAKWVRLGRTVGLMNSPAGDTRE